MYIIKTKNERYTGVLSGISFLNGVGKTEKLSDYDIKWFERLGHTITEETEKGKKTKKTDKVVD